MPWLGASPGCSSEAGNGAQAGRAVPQIPWEAVPAHPTASSGSKETSHDRNGGFIRRWLMMKKEKAKSMRWTSFKAGVSFLQHRHGCTSWTSAVTQGCENALNKQLSLSCCVCEHPHYIRKCWVALLSEKRW